MLQKRMNRPSHHTVKGYMESLNKLQAGFTDSWSKDTMANFSSHSRRNFSTEIVQSFALFLENRRKAGIKASKASGLSAKTAEALRTEIARILWEIRGDWPKVDMKVGMEEVLQMHQLHFTVRDAYQDMRYAADDTPEDGTLYYQMDFLEHRTLPLGPDEGGEWWYANARLSVTLLVICVWGRDRAPTYHTYASHCLEQTSEFAVSCLIDLQKRLGGAGQWKRHVMFSDVGNHFRSAYALGYWGVELLKCQVVEETKWIFAPEGHGKGVCDGQGGPHHGNAEQTCKKGGHQQFGADVFFAEQRICRG